MKKNSIFSWYRFVIIFFLIAFVVTCSFLLFLSSVKIELKGWNIVATFANVLFLSLIFCIFDGIQRKILIEKPLKEINKMTSELAKGNFKYRISGNNNLRGEFTEIAEDLNVLATELGGIETLRNDFTSNVSHELKTPLAAINNYASLLLLDSTDDEKKKEYALEIQKSTTKLSSLITNILKLNKLENQEIYPNETTYNLSEQLSECLLVFENVWEDKKIELITDFDEDIEIKADKELLSLVWNNLLSNAFKFTPENGEVQVKLKKENNNIMVSVSDNGCGMDAATGRHIFDKFYQGDTSHATNGNGLGLALVKRIIDIMKANIKVESELNKGTTFIVTLKGE